VHNKVAKDATLTVADRSKIFPQTAQAEENQPGSDDDEGQLGLHVEELTPDIARKLGMGSLRGVVVTEVDPASFAEDIEFNRGYVITEINHTAINGMADYKTEMAKLKPGEPVLFKVASRGDADKILTLYLAGAVPTLIAK
jgi:serine protease Do